MLIEICLNIIKLLLVKVESFAKQSFFVKKHTELLIEQTKLYVTTKLNVKTRLYSDLSLFRGDFLVAKTFSSNQILFKHLHFVSTA